MTIIIRIMSTTVIHAVIQKVRNDDSVLAFSYPKIELQPSQLQIIRKDASGSDSVPYASFTINIIV
jgi:hypothetical protein